jgi:hypothetical protein
MPSAPGNVPKYESKDRFSCMMTTTCWILWIASPAGAGGGEVDDPVDDDPLEDAPDDDAR